jgi:threonine dehydrogenase-like Zn-dependent dehydrogenase
LESKVIELIGPKKLIVKKEKIDIKSVKPNELIGETLYSAISPGTEVAAYKGDPPLRPGKVYPRVLGYCNVAEVVMKGDSVTKYEIGDRILTFQSHRSSFICKEESIITKIPENADLIEATTTYLFQLGYNALLKGNFKPGYNVAVIGLGTLGLMTVVLANLFGAKVYAFSNQRANLELAKEFGACLVFNKDAISIYEVIDRNTGGVGIDIVVTTSNNWEDWKLAISLARKEGTICVLGFPGRKDPIPPFNPLDSQFFYDRQLQIIACGYSPDLEIPSHDIRFTVKRNCKFILDLIIQKKIPARRFISSISHWEDIEEIYKIIADRKVSFLTSVLKWK